MLNSRAAYEQLLVRRMEDTSYGGADASLDESFQRCSGAMQRPAQENGKQPYAFFVGDLASYTPVGYKAMLTAKSGLVAWNKLVVALQENTSTVAQLAAAGEAQKTLLLVEPPPAGVTSEFQRSWEKCREKAILAAGVAACLTFLTNDAAPFPTGTKKNPLLKHSGVCKEIASRMFQRNKTKANIELAGGSVETYAMAVHTADAWAKYGSLTGAEQTWLFVHQKAIASQSAQASQAIDAKAQVKDLMDRC